LGAPDSYNATGTSYRATCGIHQETEDCPFKPAVVAAATGCRDGISAGREIWGLLSLAVFLEMLSTTPSPERQETTPERYLQQQA